MCPDSFTAQPSNANLNIQADNLESSFFDACIDIEGYIRCHYEET